MAKTEKKKKKKKTNNKKLCPFLATPTKIFAFYVNHNSFFFFFFSTQIDLAHCANILKSCCCHFFSFLFIANFYISVMVDSGVKIGVKI